MEMGRQDEDLTAYEGLVIKTSQMFAGMVGLELDDMKQELRLKVLKARRSFAASRSSMTEQAYVYSVLANLVKDLKRNAARRANGPLRVTHIEEYFDLDDTGEFQWFEHQYLMTTHDEVYGQGEGAFVMPATVTAQEQEIIYLLVIGYAQTEIAVQLELEYADVVKRMRVLREKFGDWRPSSPPQELPVVAPVAAAPAAIAA